VPFGLVRFIASGRFFANWPVALVMRIGPSSGQIIQMPRRPQEMPERAPDERAIDSYPQTLPDIGEKTRSAAGRGDVRALTLATSFQTQGGTRHEAETTLSADSGASSLTGRLP
jgi:hypothetical protein